MITVMIFGTFDGLHDGHLSMLKEAKGLGDYLIVVVAQDHIVEYFKKRPPKKNLAERFEHLKNADGVDKVVIGDSEVGVWNVVKRFKPDIIGIGHDQQELKHDLENNLKALGYNPQIVALKYHER